MELKKKTIRIINCEPKKDSKEEKQQVKEWKEVQLQISENGVMSVRNVESCECSPIPAVEAPPVYSPSSIPSSKNNINHISSHPQPATITPQAIDNHQPDKKQLDPATESAECQSVKAPSTVSETVNSLVVVCAPSASTNTPPPADTVANSLPATFVVSTPAIVTTSSSLSTASTPVSTQQCLTTSALPPSINQTPSLSMSPTTTSLISLPSSPVVAMSICSTTTQPSPMSNQTTAITTVNTPVFSASSLPSPLSLSSPQVCANSPSSSQAIEPSIVTTMSSMKNTTNLVPANFPIMSTCRPQTEPIVSVSKVSKDQVRKPNNVIEVNKLSISRVQSTGMKEKEENLNKIVNKLSPNERVIGNTSVTIRPVTNTSTPLKPQSTPKTSTLTCKEKSVKYRTLKSPALTWNPSIDRNTMLLKHASDPNKTSRFFKMRNMPRFLGNPASGVKPLYACPEEPSPNQPKQKLTLMKIDPKSTPTGSMPRSPTKQPPPYTPGSPKMSKPPPAYPDPKPFMSPRMPSPAHSGSFLPTNPYHLLYNSYPGFSHDTNRMLSPELIRSMCAFHPSLPPPLGMLFTPSMHPSMSPRPQDGFKPETTPAVQRIPPSKTETPPPKPIEEKRFPSPVGPPESKKLTPPPASPKENEKPNAVASQEPPPKVSSPVVTEPASKNDNVKEIQSEPQNVKPNSEENNLEKINCDDININNNNSKESPVAQPSECLTSRPQ